MKKILKFILAIPLVLLVISCEKKATPQQIEDFQIITKTNEILEEHNYMNFDSSVKEDLIPFYTIDYKTDIISIDYEKIFNSYPEIVTKLNAFKEQHEKYHKDIIPGTEEWNYWMTKVRTSTYFGNDAIKLNEKNRYDKKNPKKIYISRQQRCPFCIFMDKQLYKDGIKHDSETITYPENWQDIDMFLSKQLEEFKKSNMNEEYYKKQNEYIINCFTNFSKARFERMINQEWENEKSKTKVPDENSFKKKWKDKMIKYSGVIEKISRDSYGDGLWYVTISGMECELLSPKYVKKYDCYVKRYDTESPYYFRVDERNKSYKMARYLSNNNLVSEELFNSSLKKIAEDKLLDHRRFYDENEINKLNVGDKITIIGDIGGIYFSDTKWHDLYGLKYCQIISVNGKSFEEL